MAQYNSFVITDKGRALIAKTIAGENDKFRFTEIATSDKTYPESALAALTELASVKQQVKISKIEKFTDTQVKIEAAIENSAVADGYYINTIGLYAADGEEEVLYAVCTAAVAGYIPEYNNVSAAGSIFEFVVNVGSAEKVSLEIDPAAVATIADMKQHKEEIQEELKGKADVDHTHTKSEITDFPSSMKNPNSLTLTMNGTASTYNGEVAASKSWYAPTTAGTAGYELVSNGSGAPVWKAPAYAVCSTAAATVAKTVSISNFKLVTGVSVKVKFTYANSAATPTLNVNSTGAKQIAVCKGSSSYTLSSVQTWTAGEIVEFVYNGTYWVAVSSNQGFMQKKYNTVVIGTSASGHTYANADYICTGTNDNTVFQNAINNMPKGGTIKVLAGRYNFAAPIEIPSSNYYSYIIEGEGVSYSTSYVTTMIYCTNHAFAAVKNSIAELAVKNISFYLAGTLSADSPFIKSGGDVTLTDCKITASTTAVSGDTNYIDVTGDVNIQNCDIDITRTFTASSMICASFIDSPVSSMASIRGCNIKLTNSVTAMELTANFSLARSNISITACNITLVGKSNNAKAIISEGSGHISNCYINISDAYGDISKITGQASPYLTGSFTNNSVIYGGGCYISFAQVMGNYFGWAYTTAGTIYFNGIAPIVIGNRFKIHAKNTVVCDSEQGIIFVNNALNYSCTVSSVSSAIVKDNIIFSL